MIQYIFGKESKLVNHAEKNVYSKELRHPILHGRQIDYNDAQNSTMLILLLFVMGGYWSEGQQLRQRLEHEIVELPKAKATCNDRNEGFPQWVTPRQLLRSVQSTCVSQE